MQLKKVLSTCAVAAALAATGYTGASTATATTNDPYIIGGQESSSPWTVQLNFKTYGETGTYACTGKQLNSEWVLTARHCIDGSYNMQVFQSNDQTNPVPPSMQITCWQPLVEISPWFTSPSRLLWKATRL